MRKFEIVRPFETEETERRKTDEIWTELMPWPHFGELRSGYNELDALINLLNATLPLACLFQSVLYTSIRCYDFSNFSFRIENLRFTLLYSTPGNYVRINFERIKVSKLKKRINSSFYGRNLDYLFVVSSRRRSNRKICNIN